MNNSKSRSKQTHLKTKKIERSKCHIDSKLTRTSQHHNRNKVGDVVSQVFLQQQHNLNKHKALIVTNNHKATNFNLRIEKIK
jgi:hypothetical protein